MPEECEHNRDVLLHLLSNYGAIVVPAFSSLVAEAIKRIADSVAYLLRTDLIKDPEDLHFGPSPLKDRGVLRVASAGESVHLRNDPSVLCPDWKLPKGIGEEYTQIAREFFRCYVATISFIPGMNRKLDPLEGNSFNSAFPLADMTAYLLDPLDLTDCRYAKGEVTRFRDTLIRQIGEI